MDLATGGFDAVAWEVALFVCDAAMAGEDPVLLAIVADPDLPDVVRQRAFGRIPARREPAATQANAR